MRTVLVEKIHPFLLDRNYLKRRWETQGYKIELVYKDIIILNAESYKYCLTPNMVKLKAKGSLLFCLIVDLTKQNILSQYYSEYHKNTKMIEYYDKYCLVKIMHIDYPKTRNNIVNELITEGIKGIRKYIEIFNQTIK